ncbi:hypothetical protein RRS09_000387 [Enterococcus faecium]|uniref:hypothetical protein n=1 Tax=Enterococcus TaxID=1350 RepID=UPI000E969678|nr:hypothetical protein [Enterococcus faecium]HBR81743.1 hypothetical protein [Enterococcus sp.]
MMADKQYSVISDAVYWLDPKHRDYVPEMQENLSFKINGTMYKILKIKNSFDGMQAMAAAPIVHSKLEKNFKNKKIPANFRVFK